MAPCILSLFIGILTIHSIRPEIITCSGDCECPSKAPQPGATCILDCGGVDRCKGHTLTCRDGDPCEIHCDGKATCSSGTIINAKTATDVSIRCNAEDSCKSDIDITCGSGHCYLECDESTSCENWGKLDLSRSQSFECNGKCPSAVPAPFIHTFLPSLSPTIPTRRPTLLPTIPTINPTTAIPSQPPTLSPTNYPTNAPTPSPTHNPAISPTNTPTFTANTPTKKQAHTTSTTSRAHSLNSTSEPTLHSLFESEIQESTEEPMARHVFQTGTMDNLNTLHHASLSVTSGVIIILSIALCCAFLIALWAFVLHSKDRKGESQLEDIDYKPSVVSKSPSVASPTILSVGFNSNDTTSALTSVYKTNDGFPGDEGSSDASSSDDLYRKLTQNVENEVMSTGQSPLSVIHGHINSISVNPPYPYVPQHIVMHSSPYSYASVSAHTPVYMARDRSLTHGHFPSLSLHSSIPVNMCYVPGAQLQPVGFPHIAGEDGVNELPSIPPGSVRDEDEFSHATVTSKEPGVGLENTENDENIDGNVNHVIECKDDSDNGLHGDGVVCTRNAVDVV